MVDPASQFIFVTCQTGMEKVLLKELESTHPDLTLAYSRPGFVTLKNRGERLSLDKELHLVFARQYGFVLERCKENELSQKLSKLVSHYDIVHVFPRDEYFPGSEPEGENRNANRFYDEAQDKITKLGLKISINVHAKKAERVLDVIWVNEDEWFLAEHIHTEDHSRFPGGRPRLELPIEAPSRAYLKAEEALLQLDIKTTPGERALEIGCTPGGTLYLLLSRKLQVIGIDPHLPDSKLLKLFPKTFQFFKSPIEKFDLKRLPSKIDYLFWDVSLPFTEVWEKAFLVLETIRPRHAFFTFKMTHLDQAMNISLLTQAAQKKGLGSFKVKQLSYQRQEFLFYFCIF